MKSKRLKLGVGVACVVVAVSLIFWNRSNPSPGDKDAESIAAGHASDPERVAKSGRVNLVPDSRLEMPPDLPEEPQPLDFPTVPVVGDGLGATTDVAIGSPNRRQSLTDDEILTMGRVLPVAAKPVANDDKTTRLKSMKSEDWKGQANLLVNALRAGEGFEVNHDQLLAFISGKDLLGWPEGLRNWIGDELMTALRQDMPKTAFGDLKSIVENTAAPAAMRDYSVQHISHLMTSGVLGQEGADFIWQTLEKNDPQTLSTALISLHRLSEQVPDLVAAKQVQATAERLKDSLDERTRITAESILKHGAAIQGGK